MFSIYFRWCISLLKLRTILSKINSTKSQTWGSSIFSISCCTLFYGSSEPHQWHQEIDSLPLGLRRTRCRFTSVWWKVASQPSTSIASTKDSPGRACEDVEHVGPWLAGKFIDYQQHATRMFMLDRYIIIAVDVLPICNTRNNANTVWQFDAVCT